jgi:hypothetical protein
MTLQRCNKAAELPRWSPLTCHTFLLLPCLAEWYIIATNETSCLQPIPMYPNSQRLRLLHTAPADPYSHCHAGSATHCDVYPEPDEEANAEPATASYLNTNSCPAPNPDTDPGRLSHCLCLRP